MHKHFPPKPKGGGKGAFKKKGPVARTSALSVSFTIAERELLDAVALARSESASDVVRAACLFYLSTMLAEMQDAGMVPSAVLPEPG